LFEVQGTLTICRRVPEKSFENQKLQYVG